MTGRQAASLRGAIQGHGPARGKRYTPKLKARIIEFGHSRRAEGASWAQIAEDLGVAFETVRRWCSVDVESPRAMVPVQVVAEPSVRTVSIVSAAGYRIEGLALHEAVALLRELG